MVGASMAVMASPALAPPTAKLAGRAGSERGEGPHREGPHADDRRRGGGEAERPVGQSVEVGEVLDDVDPGGEELGVHGTLAASGEVDVDRVDPDQRRPGG